MYPALRNTHQLCLKLDLFRHSGTNSSQFFITLTPLPELNNSRTIFGRVIQGLDLLQGLNSRDPIDDLLTPPEELIVSVTIEVR